MQRSFKRLAVPLLVTASVIALGVACTKKKSSWLKDDIRYFQEMLRADMDYDEIVEVFGMPVDLNEEFSAKDGLHIYQYPLYDTTFVRIGYSDKIVYACLVDDRNNIVRDIIAINQESK